MGVVPRSLDGANLTENAVKIITNGKVEQRFLKYALQTKDAMAQMKALAGGAAQPKLGIYKIETIEIPLPPLSTQRFIANLLSIYDHLIANNNSRINILEEIARSLFEEWFVCFRSPGTNSVPTVESAVGPIPQDWQVRQLSEMSQVVMGQSPKSEHYNFDCNGLPFHQGVADFGSLFLQHRVYCAVEQRVAEPDDILVSVRAPVGRINLTADRIVIGRGLAAIRPNEGLWCFVLGALRHFFDEEDKIGSDGAIFKSVGRAELERLAFAFPPEMIVAEFNRIAKPIWDLIKNLTFAGRNLRAQRDLLIPKLISGEFDVSNAERVMEAAE